jgi:3-phosphoshikimate 1-carboxyvinyltransferase
VRHGAHIGPQNHHRIAMSFAVAGLAVGDWVMQNEMCVGKAFPGFWETLKAFA